VNVALALFIRFNLRQRQTVLRLEHAYYARRLQTLEIIQAPAHRRQIAGRQPLKLPAL
jgi:hypothetical protein